MSISDYAENKLLDAVFNSTAFSVTGDPYVSLHDGAVGETGANEVTGGSYARQQAAFGAAAAGAVANTGTITYTDMPAVGGGGVTDVGVWDAVSAGNFLWGGTLTAAKTTNAGDTFTIAVGDLDVTLD